MIPTRACSHPDGTGIAIFAKGSPDEQQQITWFERRHQGPGHQRVKRLPDDHGDVAWGWTPGTQKRVSAASARRTPDSGVAAVLARPGAAAERITSLQGGGT